jgi:hypothetical protein
VGALLPMVPFTDCLLVVVLFLLFSYEPPPLG